MSYLPIARKYRPQRFSEVIGQAVVVKTLGNAITLKRLHPAYLFCGIRGVGKTSLARILAKSLNCEQGPTMTPCGECAPCREIAQGISLDVLEIDGASNTGVDDIRELKDQAHYLPQHGKYKIYIIDEVHMLSASAFNALLKLLEEPPPHVIFCFATTELHKIPLTVLSRCQRFELKRIPFAEIVAQLKSICASEKVDCDDEALHRIARLGDGSLRDSLSLLDQAIGLTQGKVTRAFLDEWLGFSNRELLYKCLEAVIAADSRSLLDHLQSLHQTSIDPERFVTDFLELVRTLLLIKAGLAPQEAPELSSDEYARLKENAAKLESEVLDWLFQMASKGLQDLAVTALPFYTLEILFLRFLRAPQLRALLRDKGKDGVRHNPVRAEVKPAPVSKPTPSARGPDPASWRAFVTALQKDEPQIGSLVAPLKWQWQANEAGEGVLSLYPGEQKFYADQLKSKQTRIAELARAFFKCPLRAHLVEGSATQGKELPLTSVLDEVRTEESAKLKQAQKEVSEHSLVKTLTEIFGGTIQEVKPL